VPHASTAGLTILGAAVGLRLILHILVRRRLGAHGKLRLLLVPLRECLCFGVWAASFLGSNIRWRQNRFSIGRGGILIPLAQRL